MFSAEIETVILCAHNAPSREQIGRIKSIVGSPLFNWQRLWNLAQAHGVDPLVAATFNYIQPDPRPDALRSEMQMLLRRNSFNNIRLARSLFEILDLLAANGIQAVPHKGVALAQRVYKRLDIRHVGDLDILVPRKDAIAAMHLARDAGFLLKNPRRQLSSHEERLFLQIEKTWEMHRNRDNLFLELHWRVTKPHLGVPPDESYLWDRFSPISLSGRNVPFFTPETTLLILCNNAANDYWSRLKTLCDIDALVRSFSETQFDYVWQQSRVWGCRRILAISLLLCRALWGTKVAVANDLHPSHLRIVERYAALTERTLRSMPRGDSSRERLTMRVPLFDHKLSQAKFLLRMVRYLVLGRFLTSLPLDE